MSTDDETLTTAGTPPFGVLIGANLLQAICENSDPDREDHNYMRQAAFEGMRDAIYDAKYVLVPVSEMMYLLKGAVSFMHIARDLDVKVTDQEKRSRYRYLLTDAMNCLGSATRVLLHDIPAAHTLGEMAQDLRALADTLDRVDADPRPRTPWEQHYTPRS